jgi:response regulator RpfG family c-di-GMP phosphodiesterase
LLLENEVHKATQQIIKRELETLKVLGNAAEFKDPETGDHIQRVSHYCKIIAEDLGMDQEFIKILFYASPLHDVGKIGIPDNILLKPGKLDQDEWNIMVTHAKKGYDILKNGESPYLKAGAEIALSHHEKFNGTGYPQKLKGVLIYH